ncbi:MAG: protein kinase [Rhodanobacteraceae bacterium]|nr:protein kinase [Rhodanobacteraceae bacterium]
MNAVRAALLQSRWPQASALLDELLDQPESRRLDWLAGQPLDTELALLMRQLLAAPPPAVLDADPLAALADAACWQRRLGPWRVLRPLGAGGSASVYLGERADGAYAQTVAIKNLRNGVLDARERERFARERQLLARLQHPGIARLVDGGITPEGAPYLVLEHIAGLPLDHWCDAQRLPLRQRLALFLAVCATVQFAHRHLVIHRDLKPGNILVDGEGQVKLLDFGIARLLDDSEAPTATAERRLTPAYAAPEQIAGGVMSTAVDVYALGVLLHELLSGARPDRTASLTRLALVAPTEAVRARQLTSPRALAAVLRGDLQAIVETALASDPARRYASVAALALDIERYLEGLPVAVRSAARGYRLQRWLRRHAVASGAAVLLLIGLAASAAYLHRQSQAAQAQAARAQAVQEFLIELLQTAAGDGVHAAPTRVDELMRLAAARARQAFGEAPATRAELLGTLGRLLLEQGRLDDARAALIAAQGVEHAQLGADEHGSLGTRLALAQIHAVREPEAGAAQLRAVLAEQRRSGAAAADQARALETLGFIDSRAGRHPQALAQLREAVTLGAGDARLGTTRMLYGDALQRAGDHAGALRQWQQALADVPAQSVLASRVLCSIGYAHFHAGDLAQARTAFEHALELQRQLLPREHPYLAVTLIALGTLELDSGYPAAARAHFEQAMPMRESLYGHDSVEAVEPMVGMARALADGGNNPGAVSLLRDALGRLGALPIEQQPTRAWVLLQLSAALRRQGEAQEALQLAIAALPIYQQAHGADSAKARDAQAHIAAARAMLAR